MGPLALLLAALLPLSANAAGHVHPSDADAKTPAHQHHPVDPQVPPPEGRRVDLTGASSRAYLAEPQGKPRGAVLVVHEWWGLNGHIEHEADLLAKQGYLALAVDLYDGKVATTPGEASALMERLDDARATTIEKAGIAYLKQAAPGVKLATLGWCMGGGQSLNASLADPAAVSGTVMYYGMPVFDVAKLKTLRGPLLGIFAKHDGWITPDKVAAFDRALTAAGVKHELRSYDADHGFANPTGGKYNPPAAKDADARRDAFLARLFGAP